MITHYEINALNIEDYSRGNFFHTRLWSLWRHSMPKIERIAHAKAAIRLRAEIADENRKRNLRKIFKRLSKIENAEFKKIENVKERLKIVYA